MTKTKALKILLAADGHGAEVYDGALAKAFESLGHTVHRFTWKEAFHNYPYANVYPTDAHTPLGRLKSIYYRLQNKFMFGPAMWKLNRQFLKQAETLQPDIIFLYRPTHLWGRTIARLRQTTKATIMAYNNDDPFSPTYPPRFWRHFRAVLPHCHHIFAYRHKNLTDLANLGYNNTSLLRSYYVKEDNFPIPSTTKQGVSFLGHYEPDGRDQTLRFLLENNISLKIFGTGWTASPHNAYFESKLGGPIKALYGKEYNLAINSAQIALVFLSKLNSDTYTRRCFEIPATGTCMVSQYTEDQATNLYTPDYEAIYFDSKEDLLTKLTDLLSNPKLIHQIGHNGLQRLQTDGHEITDRAHQIIETVHDLQVNY